MYQKPCRLTRADKCYFGGGAPSVPQQNLGQELGQILKYLPKFTQKQFDLSRKFGPKFTLQDLAQSKWTAPAYAQLGLDVTKKFGPQYAQQGFNIARQLAPQYLGLNQAQQQRAIAGSPLLSAMNQQAQTGLRTGGVTDFLGNLRSAAQANLARGGIDPYLQGLAGQADRLTNLSNTGLASSYANLARGGGDPLLGQLSTQAQQQLGQQGRLTPQEAYQATQGTLGTFAGRGNVFRQAEAQAFLDRDALVRQRRQQEQAFAGNVEAQRQGALGLAQSQLGQAQQFGLGAGQYAGNIGQLRQAALGQAQQFGLGTQGALQNALAQAQQYGTQTQAMNQAALQGLGGAVQPPNYAAYAQAPNLAAYGAPGSSNIPMGAGLGVTQGQTQPLLNFGQNLFDANQNAAATQNIAAANKSGGLTGAGIGALGSIAGAAIGL
jgi:hypothetical protein